MRYGISIPNFGDYADVREVAALAARAEEAGFDGFFTWDHLHYTGWMPGGPPAPLPASDPIVALTAIALATERVRFGPMVMPLPRRRPWKVARETVTLDRVSNGRLVLGVGLGFPADEEYGRFGEPASDHERAELLDEGLEVLTRLWAGGPASFKGRHMQLDGAEMLPGPVQQPRIPIWCAGMWPGSAPFRRAAKWDGVFPISATGGLCTPNEVRAVRDLIAARRGTMDGYDVVAGAGVDALRGSPQEREYADAGATWLMYSPYGRAELETLLAG
jgi:probable F420-dependent oxidoreductase